MIIAGMADIIDMFPEDESIVTSIPRWRNDCRRRAKVGLQHLSLRVELLSPCDTGSHVYCS